jgi:hypothetical protein
MQQAVPQPAAWQASQPMPPASSPTAWQPTTAQQPPSQEQVLFQHENILVTNSRYQVGTTMYPINGITAVAIGTDYPLKTLGVAIAFFFGLPLLLIAILMMADKPLYGTICMMIGAIPTALGGWVALRSQWTVQIATAGTQVHSVKSKNREYVAQIVGALQQAIASRL